MESLYAVNPFYRFVLELLYNHIICRTKTSLKSNFVSSSGQAEIHGMVYIIIETRNNRRRYVIVEGTEQSQGKP